MTTAPAPQERPPATQAAKGGDSRDLENRLDPEQLANWTSGWFQIEARGPSAGYARIKIDSPDIVRAELTTITWDGFGATEQSLRQWIDIRFDATESTVELLIARDLYELQAEAEELDVEYETLEPMEAIETTHLTPEQTEALRSTFTTEGTQPAALLDKLFALLPGLGISTLCDEAANETWWTPFEQPEGIPPLSVRWATPQRPTR